MLESETIYKHFTHTSGWCD